MKTSRVVGLTALALKGMMILLAIFSAGICVGLIRAGSAYFAHLPPPRNGLIVDSVGGTITLLIAVSINIYILQNMQKLVSNFNKGFVFIAVNVKYLDSLCTFSLILKAVSLFSAFFMPSATSLGHYEDFYGSWLAAVMSFIFARVFEEGVRLNDEAQFTV
jgi:hypothetical protein